MYLNIDDNSLSSKGEKEACFDVCVLAVRCAVVVVSLAVALAAAVTCAWRMVVVA